MSEIISFRKGLTLVAMVGLGAAACAGGQNLGEKVKSCTDEELAAAVEVAEEDENNPRELLDFNNRLSAPLQESGEEGTGDYLDKVGEIVCHDPNKPEELFFNEDGQALRSTFLAH